jgi:hypothetical protein
VCRFYPRWKEWETRQAQELHFSLADSQWAADWADLLRYKIKSLTIILKRIH